MIAKYPNSKRNPARIGIIVAGASPIEGFKEGLAKLGWIEERNVNFAIRVAQGQIDRLPGLALRHELVINVRTARKLCMTVPLELLDRASQVID